MAEITSPINLHVSTPDGMYSCYLAANTPMTVPDVLLPHVQYALVQAGQSALGVADGASAVSGPSREEKVAAIAAAYKQILAKNDPELLDSGGIPRQNELENVVGFRTNKKDRDDAWAEVEG